MQTRRRIVGVSLKMYMGLERTQHWLRSVADMAERGLPADVDLFVIPSFLSLSDARTILAGHRVAFGAQDVFWEDEGAYTGEISAPMLAEAGCRFVEIGHAERRRIFGETEDMIRRKIDAAVRSGLVPVLCIGEATKAAPEDVVIDCMAQFETVTAGIDKTSTMVFAWEPIWAIGAAKPASADYIAVVARGLRDALASWPNLRLIYGGSAGPGLLDQIGDAVDGLFLGRFAHDTDALRRVLAEASASTATSA